MIKRLLIVVLMINTFSFAKASDTTLVTGILKRLLDWQYREDNYFKPGLFPTYRQYIPNKRSVKKDESIFFSGLIGIILQQYKHRFTPYQHHLSDSILKGIHQVSDIYLNRKGKGSYNFWPLDRPIIYPNSGWINLFNESGALPDDLDDTSIMLLALNASLQQAEKVHQLMQQYCNTPETPVHITLPKYRNYKGYGVWFGKKMNVEFDVCVMANGLLMVQRYNLKWTAADSATLQVLEKMIADKDHMRKASFMSINYKKPAIILYHIARLMAEKPIPSLEQHKKSLIADIQSILKRSDNFIEQLLLNTSLLKLGYQPNQSIVLKDTDDFIRHAETSIYPFFIGDWVCIMPLVLSNMLLNCPITKFDYYCPAHYNALLLEYLMEINK